MIFYATNTINMTRTFFEYAPNKSVELFTMVFIKNTFTVFSGEHQVIGDVGVSGHVEMLTSFEALGNGYVLKQHRATPTAKYIV